ITLTGEHNCSSFPRRALFFFPDAATTEIYTLSLHDALPIWSACFAQRRRRRLGQLPGEGRGRSCLAHAERRDPWRRTAGGAAPSAGPARGDAPVAGLPGACGRLLGQRRRWSIHVARDGERLARGRANVGLGW